MTKRLLLASLVAAALALPAAALHADPTAGAPKTVSRAGIPYKPDDDSGI